jgi:hypothetical protein
MRQSTLGVLAALGLATLAFGPAFARPNPLERVVSIDRPIEQVSLRRMIDRLGTKYRLTLRVDEDGFTRAGTEKVSDKPVSLPRMAGVPLALVLEVVAQKVGGTVKVEEDRLAIVPGKRELAAILRPAGKKMKEKLAEVQQNEADIEDAPLGDIVEYFSDKWDLTIVVADWSFPKGTRTTSVLDTKCKLAAGAHPLGKWLELLARQVGGKVVATESVILIVPQPKDAP